MTSAVGDPRGHSELAGSTRRRSISLSDSIPGRVVAPPGCSRQLARCLVSLAPLERLLFDGAGKGGGVPIDGQPWWQRYGEGVMKRVALIVTAFVVLLPASNVRAEIPPPKPKAARLVFTDIVKVTDFKVANFESADPPLLTVRQGDQVSLVLTIKNVSSRTLPKVAAVMSQTSPLPAPAPFSCTQYRDAVAPGESFSMTCVLPATTQGAIVFHGTIVDDGTPEVREKRVQDRLNNSRDLTVHVSAASRP